MRVELVSKVALNPYVELLRRGLVAQGLQAETQRLWGLGTLRARPRPEVVHLHWPELQYAYPEARTRLKRLGSFLGGLLAARAAGVRLVLTLHNATPHEGEFRGLHQRVGALIARWVDRIHIHDGPAGEALGALFAHHAPTYTAPHFSYAGWYPPAPSREAARAALGLPAEGVVLLSLGHLRPYKGNDRLLGAFAAWEEPTARLVIAGKPHLDAEHQALLAALAARDPRVAFLPRYIPDEEVPTLMAAASAVALPYRQATTSGAALLAFTFRRPVLAPRLGPFPALAEAAPTATLLYDPAEPDALQGALRALPQRLTPSAEAEAAALAAARAPHAIAALHAAAYRELRLSGGGR